MIEPFKNEPFLDYTQTPHRNALAKALQDARRWYRGIGGVIPSLIDGQPVATDKTFASVNPNDTSETIATFAEAGPENASKAVIAAHEKFQEWKRRSPHERAAYLFKLARLMRQRRHEMNALMILEVGKSWREADADTAEAIDFLEFYGRETLRLGQGIETTPYPGELNELHYIPMGVVTVIPPWNFPNAILTGMTAAAIVSGNTVVLKPSPDASLIAQVIHDMFSQVGLPAGVINLVYGGPETGEALVTHPLTRVIAFTGSKKVGLHIHEIAAKHQPGQLWLKRVVAEMGGKDTILVDSACDLEAAVDGVLASAFGFSGQKCSACSRAIIHEDVRKEFTEALVERAKELKVGPTEDPDNFLGAVINAKAKERFLTYAEHGKKEGALLLGGEAGDGGGHSVLPTIFADVDVTGHLFNEEVFAPMLALTGCRSFEEGLALANSGEYGLTGAVFSLDRGHINRARNDFHVGNLYINRKCTGALVDVQPFGGFNMSGTDSKAGGRDYLLHFQQAKSLCERL